MKKWIISAKTSRTVGKVCSYILLIFFACIFFFKVMQIVKNLFIVMNYSVLFTFFMKQVH